MDALYYVKYVKGTDRQTENVWINCILDEWETGFSVDSYLIEPDCIYFEDASWSGKKLDYSTLGKPIKRKEYQFVQDTIARCRQELEFWGMSGEKLEFPNLQVGHYYFQFAEDKDDEIPERYASFYRIISVDGDVVTYKEHSVDDHYICHRDERTCDIESFLLAPDNAVWYEIMGETFDMARKKIVLLAETLLSKFRES